MKIYILKRRQTFKQQIDEVFNFFKKPENLEKITPKSVRFKILTPPPIKMKIGTVLDYTIHLAGLPVRWTTLISNFEPPYRFADVALKSPYSFWHHTHTFEENSGGTIMTDEVCYSLPFGPLGRIIHSLWVKRQLDYIFNYRAQIISEILETKDEPAEILNNIDTNPENT